MDDVNLEQPEEVSAEEREQVYLRALRRPLELGACATLNFRLTKFGQHLAASKSPTVLLEFAEILREAAKAYAIEHEHGDGCLLNLDHPVVSKQIERDERFNVRLIPEHRVEAARRYRAFIAQDR